MTDHLGQRMEVIGTVEYTNPPSVEKARWTRLRPLYHEDDGLWVPIADAVGRTTLFPDEGLVFWWDSPPDAEKESSYWIVRLEHDREARGPDKMRVVDFWPFHHFEETPGVDVQNFRRRCARKELELRHQPLGSVLLRLPNSSSEWIGPMDFEPSTMRKRHVFRGPIDVPTGFLGLYDVAEENLQRLPLAQGRVQREVRVLKPQRRLDEARDGFWTAQDDEHLLHGVLKRLQHLDHGAAEALKITDRTFQEYLERLSTADLIGEDSRREQARAEAARGLLEEATLNRQTLEEITEVLMLRPDVSLRVQEAVQERTDARVAEVEQSLREMEQEKEARLAELDSEIQGREAELAKGQERLRRQENEARERLEAVVRGIMEEPVEILAENFLLQAIASNTRECRGEPITKVGSSLTAEGDPIESLASLLGAARAGAMQLGLAEEVCLSGIAALLAGRRVLVSGDRGLDVCRLLGSLVSGSSVWEVIFPTSIFGIEDVLNLPATRTDGVDAVTSLGEVFLAGADSEQLVTLVLRGLNRAPLEAAFDELIASDSRGPNAPLAWSKGASRTSFARVPAPTRLHILGTLSTGSTCFKVSGSLADRLALLESDRGSSATAEGDQSVPRMCATEARWREIAEEAREVGESFEPSFTMAKHEGLEAEFMIYAGIFGEEPQAAAEFLIARRARQLATAGSDFIERLPNDVIRAVDSAKAAGALDGALRHLDRG